MNSSVGNSNRYISPRALRLAEVVNKTGLSRSYTYKLIKDGDFPSPKKVRDRISVWDEREVDSWLEKTFLNPSLVEEGISND